MWGRGLGCGRGSPCPLSILCHLLPVLRSAPMIHPASSGSQTRGGAGHAGSHGLPPPSWSSLFHLGSTTRAVAHEAGHGWCILLVSVKSSLVMEKKREKKTLPGACSVVVGGCLDNLTWANTIDVYSLCIWGIIRLIGGSRIWPTGYILGISHVYITSTALLGNGTLHSPPLGAPTARHLIVYITY